MFQTSSIRILNFLSNWKPRLLPTLAWAGIFCVAAVLAGCQTQQASYPFDPFAITNNLGKSAVIGGNTTNTTNATNQTTHSESIVLREGDVVKITFPGASNLNGNHSIGRDGNITLEMVGDLKAAGKTPADLKSDLLKAYADKLETKEVNVELLSSQFPVFVTGAVVSPGKVMTDHPITALEAIMEKGGFDYTKANLKSVIVLRQDGNRLKSYTLNMKKVMRGEKTEQFYLKPLDIIYIREKFSWF